MVFVLALSLASSGASAFTPSSFPVASAATDPQIAVTVTHSKVSTPARDPKQGETFTYTMSFAITNLTAEAGVSRSLTVTVYADANAPFTAAPVIGDFSWSGGATATGTVSNCTTTSCTVTITNMPATGPTTLTFTKGATVAASLPTGTLIMASANAQIQSKPTLTLANTSSTAPSGQCSGAYTFVQTVGGSGAWLVDMKFADVAGLGKVILSPGDRTIVPYTVQNATDTVKFSLAAPYTVGGTTYQAGDAGAGAFTGAVMTNATYIKNDATTPTYIGLDPANQTKFANAKWFDSLNWPYDPSTWTGNTWLPAGTIITVTRQVTYLGCLPGGITSDGTTNREFGISTEIARATTNVQASGYDVFSMPGAAAPATCINNLYFSDGAFAGSSRTMKKWTPNGSTTTLGTATPSTDAIAASAKYPSYIFAVDYGVNSGTLRVFDTGAGTWYSPNPLPVTAPPAPATGNINALAFAPDGTLYAVTNGGVVWYLPEHDVTDALNNKTVSWKVGATLTGDLYEFNAGVWRTGATLNAKDIAFTSDGTMYVLTNYNRSAYIVTIPGSALQPQVPYSSPRTSNYSIGSVASGTNSLRSLAFVGDVLYGYWDTALHTIAWKTPGTGTSPPTMAVANATATGFSATDPSDFASCSYGVAAPSMAPAFQVQKTVINPDGSIQPVNGATGSTPGATRTLNPDGSVTIDYLVTVTNVGNQTGNQPVINDTLTLPPGFSTTAANVVLRDSSGNVITATKTVNTTGTPTVTTVSFSIPNTSGSTTLQLDPSGGSSTNPISRTYKVSVKATLPTDANGAAILTGVDWTKAGTCNTTGAGTASSGGFFNVVAFPSGTTDQDGANNNDACAPIGSAQLALTKQIVDQNGNNISGNTDSQYFTLVAGGPTRLSGVSNPSGSTGPSGTVLPGTYSLSEVPNDGGTTSGLYGLYANWSCSKALNADGTITVNAGDNVTCVIKNTKKPKIHIVKEAVPNIVGNTHVGPTITPNADGTFLATYKITVTNTSGFTTNTGQISDGFVLPTGILWNTAGTPALSYTSATGATVSGVPTAAAMMSALQASSWVALASSITNLPDQGTVVFTISLPLKLDLTAAGTSTIYQNNQTQLATCANQGTGVNAYTTMSGGIPNMTSIPNEDMTYSTIALEDNVACVPVNANISFAVKKAAANAVDANGNVTAWGPYGGTGAAVTVNSDGTVTVNYQVVVTNTGDLNAPHPAITDNLTLPSGFNLTSWTLTQGTTQISTGTTAQFTIPPSTAAVPKGGSVTYVVQVKAKAPTLTAVDWTKANTCNTMSGGTPSAGGFFNLVSLTGDTDGTDNNDACVPVTPPPSVTLLKTGPQGSSQPLTGAKFQLYGPNSQTTAVGSEVTVDANGKVTWQYLAPGTYYVKETVAPANYAVNPTLYTFTLNPDGSVTVPTGQTGGSLVVSTVSGVNLEFKNAPKVTLPAAGGIGNLPFAAIGLLLMGWGAVRLRRKGVVMS